MEQKPNTELVMYTTEDGLTKIEATFDQDTVWLSIDQMAELFQRDKSTISRHIKNVFSDGELRPEATVAKFATVQTEGMRQVERQIEYYNLDVIISVGYRVKSLRGTQFRIWATALLKEYMKKGFVLDDERLKGNGGGNYWKELLDRIRDIQSSEKVLYRQVLDLYATSVGYDPHSEESIQFFKIVQNKLHFAAHGHMAAEVIYERADADKPFYQPCYESLHSFQKKTSNKCICLSTLTSYQRPFFFANVPMRNLKNINEEPRSTFLYFSTLFAFAMLFWFVSFKSFSLRPPFLFW